MTGLAGAVLDPAAVVGSGAFVAATKMEVGVLAHVAASSPASYAIDGPILDATYGASAPDLEMPLVLPAQHVTRAYYEHFVLDTARFQWALADQLAEQLERQTAQSSTVQRAEREPAFHQLERLGESALSVALRRLAGPNRPLWLFFLQRATGERPAAGTNTVEDAAASWRRWGSERGLVG